MAGAFPLPLHVALDAVVRAGLPLALRAEARLAGDPGPRERARAMATLQRNGRLRSERAAARAAAGQGDDAAGVDGSTWDAPDPGEDGGGE